MASKWRVRFPLVLLGLGLASFIGASPSFSESDSKIVHVSATILPRLELSVTPETGDAIAFGQLEQPAAGDAHSRLISVNVNVFSNLGHPYQVTQLVRRPMTNHQGQTIPDEQFRVMTLGSTRGSLRATEATPVIPGQTTPLYTSDDRGKSDTFSAEYTLHVTPQTPAGEFDTEVVYTVTSL